MPMKNPPKLCPLSCSKATPTFLGIYYGSSPLLTFNIFTSYLFLCNKFPQNLAALKTTNIYYFTVWMGQEPGSSLTGSSASILHKVVVKISARVVGSFEGSIKGEFAS